MRGALTLAAALAASLLAGGCANITGGGDQEALSQVQQADFTSAGGEDENRLARPPNVISEVDRALLRIDEEGVSRLLPTVSQARLRREGTTFWLEVDLDPEAVWPTMREFWLEEGFDLEFEIPETGVIETDWRQDRSRILGTGLSRYLDIALERVNDTGERYKFRSRVERGPDPGTSLVFISHRAVQEVTNAVGASRFEPLDKDPTLEAEMLRRLMLLFRYEDEVIARIEDFEESALPSDLYVIDSGTLVILRGRDEAWLLLLQALDRSGYNLVSTDEGSGTVTIRTAAPAPGEDEEGILQQWFGGAEGAEPLEAVIEIAAAGSDRTEVLLPEGELGETIRNVLSANI